MSSTEKKQLIKTIQKLKNIDNQRKELNKESGSASNSSVDEAIKKLNES